MQQKDRPEGAVLGPRHRTALRAESLPAHLPVAAHQLHREVRRGMHELDLAADHGRDAWTAEQLRRAATGLREPLALHMPLHGTRCPTCRTRWGQAGRWPCHVWRVVHLQVESEAAS